MVVVGGGSYGQAASRERAARAPRFLGVRAKIAKSFARIHKANLCNFGILPLTFASEADYDALGANHTIEIKDIKAALSKGADLVLKNTTNGKTAMLKYSLSSRQRDILLAGGMLNYTRSQSK